MALALFFYLFVRSLRDYWEALFSLCVCEVERSVVHMFAFLDLSESKLTGPIPKTFMQVKCLPLQNMMKA